MAKELKKQNIGFILIAILIILVFIFLSTILLDFSANRRVKDTEKKQTEEAFFSSEKGTKITMYLPAVSSEGSGVNTVLKVEASPGTGRTLTDIDNLLFWADTQHSIRMARRVAENITGKRMEDYDIVYTITANASLIGGPSAGAALAIATVAALEGKEPREEVMITGSINHDGTIGPVSGILEKARVAKEIGADLFLVPLLQSRDVVYETTEHCEVFGHTQVCTAETRPIKIEVEQEAGIEVREVASVQDAVKYFFD